MRRSHLLRHGLVCLGLALVPGLLSLTISCAARLAAPPQLSTEGAIAFHASRVMRGIAELQEVAIRGEAAGVFSRDDARTIVTATGIAGQAGEELAQALRAASGETAAKAKAIAAIRSALTGVPARLSPLARSQLEPYVTVVLIALAILE
jgi:hypothetical protein